MSVIGNGEFSSIFIRSWSVTRDTEKQTNQKYSIMFKNAREGSNATEAAVSLCEKGLLAPCSEVPLCYAHWGDEHHRAKTAKGRELWVPRWGEARSKGGRGGWSGHRQRGEEQGNPESQQNVLSHVTAGTKKITLELSLSNCLRHMQPHPP